jgi:hypothetical protein
MKTQEECVTDLWHMHTHLYSKTEPAIIKLQLYYNLRKLQHYIHPTPCDISSSARR